jgi:hypothetical protein
MLAARVKYEKESQGGDAAAPPPESERVSRIFLAECSLLSSWQMNLCLPGEGVEEKAEGDRFLGESQPASERATLALTWERCC